MLSFLQNLLTNKQTTQAGQFGQGLGFSQQELGQQGDQFTRMLAEQAAARKAANDLQQQRQNQANQAQQFQQGQEVRQTSLPFMSLMNFFQQQNPAKDASFIDAFKKRIAQTSGSVFDPYANRPTTEAGSTF